MTIAAAPGLTRGEPQGFTCARHGPYRGRPFTLVAGGAWIAPTCPLCASEREAQERAKQEQERAKAAERAWLLTGVPERFRRASFENYETETPGQKRALETVSRYVAAFDSLRRQGTSLMLLGNTGTGKTHLACAAVVAVNRAGHRALYCDLFGMLQRIKATYRPRAEETEEQAIERFVAPALLVIDEVGVQYGSDTERTLTHRVLDLRYMAMKPTIVAGNVDLEGLALYLGERAVSRLHEANGLVVQFDWEDRRKRRT